MHSNTVSSIIILGPCVFFRYRLDINQSSPSLLRCLTNRWSTLSVSGHSCWSEQISEDSEPCPLQLVHRCPRTFWSLLLWPGSAHSQPLPCSGTDARYCYEEETEWRGSSVAFGLDRVQHRPAAWTGENVDDEVCGPALHLSPAPVIRAVGPAERGSAASAGLPRLLLLPFAQISRQQIITGDWRC